MASEVVLRFDEVNFEYLAKKPILKGACFNVHQGAKITLMGQNGAGKTTILGLIKRELKPQKGIISTKKGTSIAAARQTITRENLKLTVEEYLSQPFEIIPKNIKTLINRALEGVNLKTLSSQIVGDLSGGQQARLLLAYALIQNPDILLLDEPTNNLDQEGIDHLINFLLMYDKTVLVISHDADFLNCFTEGVIYLNNFTHQTEMYVGDYYSVVEEINRRVERERRENAQLTKQIKDRKEKVNFFAHKGGKMRKLAKKLKEETQELEENKVDVRQEDKTIRDFIIPTQEGLSGEIVNLKKVKIIKNNQPFEQDIHKVLRKNDRLLVIGPNGIGKSTLLRSLVAGNRDYHQISSGVRLGYYSQDFSTLDFSEKVFDSLKNVAEDGYDEQDIRSVAAGFLITGDLMARPVSDLSEGQKGLLSFARLVLMKPGLLILDEPTNHINFRHIPVIIKALNQYEGTLIVVSHLPEFLAEIKTNDELDLGRY